MKTTLTNIVKNSSVYGVLLGVVLIVISLFIYIFDINMFSIIGAILSFLILFLAIPITFVILSGNSLRKKYSPERQITYLDVLLNSTILLIIGFILSTIFSYILITLIAPGYLDHQVQLYMEMMSQYNLPDEEIEAGIERIQNQGNILRNIWVSAIASVVLGLLVSLVIRKKDKIEDKVI